MKTLSTIFMLFGVTLSFGQKDTINHNSIQFCQDVFKETPVDSSWSGFYIKDQDTVYFKDTQCVMIHLITTPGITIWKMRTGPAQGELEYHLVSKSGSIKKKGSYSNGRFINGIHTEYYPNGNIRYTANYSNGLRVGTWHYFTEDGNLEFECIFVDGVCAEF